MDNKKELDRLQEFLSDILDVKETTFEGVKKRVGVTKAMYPIILNLLEEETKKRNEEWITKVKKRLGDRLPKGMKGKKRQPRSRLFPYFVTGELYNSMVYEFEAYKENHYSYNLMSMLEFSSLHAILTNKGITRNGISDGAWVGWMDDLLHTRSKYRGGIPAYHKWMSALFSSKRLNHKINKIIKSQYENKVKYKQTTLF